MDVPVLTDGRVTLDALRPDDAAAMVECEDDAIRWAFQRAAPLTLDRARAQIDDATWKWRRGSLFRRFAVRKDDRFVGTILLRPSGRGPTLLEAWICPAGRGQGIGLAAVRLACRYALDDLGGASLEVEVRAGNERGHGLATAAGFEPIEGTIRQMADGRTFVLPYLLTVERWGVLRAQDSGHGGP